MRRPSSWYAVHVRDLTRASPIPEVKGREAQGIRCTRTGSEAYGVGRVGRERRSPFPSRTLVLDPALVYRKRSGLSREICGTSRIRD